MQKDIIQIPDNEIHLQHMLDTLKKEGENNKRNKTIILKPWSIKEELVSKMQLSNIWHYPRQVQSLNCL